MNCVTESLAISDAPSTRDLPKDHDFERVVTLGYYDGPGYSCPSESTDEVVFPDGPHEYDRFKSAVDLVVTYVESSPPVLVHCQAGVSRSGGVCAAALATLNNTSYDEAIADIKTVRPKVNPTPEIEDSARRYVNEDRE